MINKSVIMKSRIFCFVLLASAMSCDKIPEDAVSGNVVERMELNIPSSGFEIVRTRTRQLSVEFYPETATDTQYVWVSSHPDIVKISETGLLTAVGEGEAIIGAALSNGRKRAVTRVTVTPYVAENPIKSITLDNTELAFEAISDAPVKLGVTLEPTNPDEPITVETLEWSSDNMYVVQVADDGTVTIVGGGEATVRCDAIDGGNAFAECKVTVPGTEIKDLHYDSTGPQFDDGYYKKTYDQIEVEVPVLDESGNRTGQTETQVWLDRNLGASRRAQSFDDVLSYGSMFQWSRKADGHEKVVWNESDPSASVLTPVVTEKAADRSDAGHSNFIVSTDWAENYSEGLWGGKQFTLPSTGTVSSEQLENMKYYAPFDDVSQANNPCPYGYRVPSVYELHQLIVALAGLDNIAYNKAGTPAITNVTDVMSGEPLYMPFPGNRAISGDGMTLPNLGKWILLWSNSAQSANNAWPMRCQSTGGNTRTLAQQKGNAYPVRCIKDTSK